MNVSYIENESLTVSFCLPDHSHLGVAEASRITMWAIEDLLAIGRISEFKNNLFYFNRLKVVPEGVGNGKKIMIEFCNQCDIHKMCVLLEINPYGKRNLKSLIKFYEASGFELLSKPALMIRYPK